MDIAKLGSELQGSAQTHKKKLLRLPSIGLEEAMLYMTARPGVMHKETVGKIGANAELGPYTGENNGKKTVGITGRTLETFLGSCVELFDPNALRKTVWGQLETLNGKFGNKEINKGVLFSVMDSVMEKLGGELFSAVRKDDGTTTHDLFDGFDTITAAEIVAGNIAADKKNFIQLTTAIDSNNALDIAKTIYRGISPELKKAKTIMYCDYDFYEAYCDDYLTTTGSVAYNDKFEQVHVMGSSKKCLLAPLVSKEGSDYIHISTKKNMLYGYGAGLGEEENIEVRRGDNAFLLQLILLMFFGVQMEDISSKRLLVAKKFAG